MMVLLLKQVHLQKDVAAIIKRQRRSLLRRRERIAGSRRLTGSEGGIYEKENSEEDEDVLPSAQHDRGKMMRRWLVVAESGECRAAIEKRTEVEV
jgi:hypothetical protein